MTRGNKRHIYINYNRNRIGKRKIAMIYPGINSNLALYIKDMELRIISNWIKEYIIYLYMDHLKSL